MTAKTIDPAPADTTLPTTPAAPVAAPTPTLSILSLVLSIVAIPTGWFVLAIVGIVLGFLGRRDEPAGHRLAFWGILLGFVALFWWVAIALIGGVLALATLPIWLGGAIFLG